MKTLNRAVFVLLLAILLIVLELPSVWETGDQQGDRLMASGQYQQAGEVYQDRMRQGVAWFRAGEFERAQLAFTGIGTAEGYYNLGNSLVMQGQYRQAEEAFQNALDLRPDWNDAANNLAIATERAEHLDSKGGDLGDQRVGADEIRFNPDAPSGGQDTQVDSKTAANDQTMQALWLRRVQTRPADFLKAKFSYQRAGQEQP